MTCHSSATKTKILDIGKIAERLFEQDRIRGKLCRDFGIESIGDSMNFAESLVNSIGQVRPAEGSTADSKSNSTVFRAAALALASNMRQWSKFLKSRKEFECLLENYDPVAFCKAVKCDHTRVEQLGKCLGGQTGRPDAEAIVQWARILTNHLEYFQALKVLKKRISTCVSRRRGCPGIGGVPWRSQETCREAMAAAQRDGNLEDTWNADGFGQRISPKPALGRIQAGSAYHQIIFEMVS